MSASIALQKDVSIAYLGPPGTFSHQAAYKRFGDSVAYVPQKQIASMSFLSLKFCLIHLKTSFLFAHIDVFEAVEKSQTTYGLIPFENSTFGSVVETLDYFIHTTIKVRAETYLTVHQCLLSNSPLDKITKVYSHPQGLGQTQRWLSAHLPNAQRISVKSTAEAAQKAALEIGAAAICNEICAELYGLDVIESNIEDLTGKHIRSMQLNA